MLAAEQTAGKRVVDDVVHSVTLGKGGVLVLDAARQQVVQRLRDVHGQPPVLRA